MHQIRARAGVDREDDEPDSYQCMYVHEYGNATQRNLPPTCRAIIATDMYTVPQKMHVEKKKTMIYFPACDSESLTMLLVLLP